MVLILELTHKIGVNWEQDLRLVKYLDLINSVIGTCIEDNVHDFTVFSDRKYICEGKTRQYFDHWLDDRLIGWKNSDTLFSLNEEVGWAWWNDWGRGDIERGYQLRIADHVGVSNIGNVECEELWGAWAEDNKGITAYGKIIFCETIYIDLSQEIKLSETLFNHVNEYDGISLLDEKDGWVFFIGFDVDRSELLKVKVAGCNCRLLNFFCSDDIKIADGILFSLETVNIRWALRIWSS